MEYHLKGIPPFRAVVTDYPNDPQTFNLDMQYMVGPSLMVAPVVAGQTSREIYLPEGDWYDFWTKKKYAGKQKITIDVPLDLIPVYVKSGSIVPLAEPLQYLPKDVCFELTAHVFGEKDASFVLYEDDGVTFDYEKGKLNQVILRWKGGNGASEKIGTWETSPRYQIKEWRHWK